MTWTKEELENTLRLAHLDLHNAQKKLREVMALVHSLPLPESKDLLRCVHCGPLPISSEQKLTEHMENVHGVRSAA